MNHRRKNQVKIINILRLLGIIPLQSHFFSIYSFHNLLLFTISSQRLFFDLSYRDLHAGHPEVSELAVPQILPPGTIISYWSLLMRRTFLISLPLCQNTQRRRLQLRQSDVITLKIFLPDRQAPDIANSGFSLYHKPSLQSPPCNLHIGLIEKSKSKSAKQKFFHTLYSQMFLKEYYKPSMLESFGVIV